MVTRIRYKSGSDLLSEKFVFLLPESEWEKQSSRFGKQKPEGAEREVGGGRMFRFLRTNMLPLQPSIRAGSSFSASPPLLPPSPLPSPREAHFWYIVPDELKDASLLKQYMELLSPCERWRVSSMKGEKLKKGVLLSHALVRTTLARYTDCKLNPSSLDFRKNSFGKPEIEWQADDLWIPPALHFNVSHTSSMIACGIGIDVEEKKRKPCNNILSLARRYFSPVEVERLITFTDPENLQREFIKLWTLKEAYVKALGRGFSGAPFREFTIRFEETKGMEFHRGSESASKIVVEAASSIENHTDNWQLALFELTGSHYAAVCKERNVNIPGGENDLLRLKVWRTIPFLEDECVSETDAVKNICGVLPASTGLSIYQD